MDFLEFARLFGLPIAMLSFALVSGALGWWHFKGSVDALVAAMKAAHTDAIEERDEQIVKLEDRNRRLEALVFESLDRGERLAVLANSSPVASPTRRRRVEP